MVREFVGKRSQRCDMCKDYKMHGQFYLWQGVITKTELTICKKCAKRDSGKKTVDKLMEGR